MSARAALHFLKTAQSRGRQFAHSLAQAGRPDAQAWANHFYGRRVLGQGAEGTATRVMQVQGRQLVPTVRKEFDPTATLASPAFFERRLALGPHLPASHAKQYGGGIDSLSGRRYLDSEFIPGQAPRMSPAAFDPMRRQMTADLMRAGRRAGMRLDPRDIRAGNTVVDARTGKPRLVDAMPFMRGEAYSPRLSVHFGEGAYHVVPTRAGEGLFPNRTGAGMTGTEHAAARSIENKLRTTMPRTPRMAPGYAAGLPASAVTTRPIAPPAAPLVQQPTVVGRRPAAPQATVVGRRRA